MVDPVSIEVATAVAKVLAQWVTSRALDEVSLGRDFKNQLEKLNKKFGYIQAFLDDVNRNYSANSSKKSSLVNLWLQDVKDAAYKADDVMDEYAVEIFRRRIEARNPMEEFFNNFFKPSNHVLFHFNMAHKVKDILSLLDEVNKDAHDIGLNKVDLAASSSGTHSHHDDHHLSRTRQLAIVNASDYVGRGIHQEKLLDFICCPPGEPHLSTVAIVGMGGVGKTTLSRHLYDHERVYTDSKIWICVSLGFDVGNLLNAMVDSFQSSKSELDINVAVIKLRENLNGKKLFLVLDDVWNDDQDSWKCLKEWLYRTGIVRGSVILINTRSDQVTKAARAEFNCKLRGLSKAKSWALLHQIIFNNSISSIDSSMEEVGKRIVEKCKGVPLAIKVIGDLLQSKPRLHEWETIEKSELWDLPCGQNQIFPSLLLSFNSLPSSSVKQCFAYCAILPKDFLVSKIELIGLWLSQGYICEEIGEENLEILLSNSLLERVSIGHGFVGYKMHDLLYGLAVFVCGSDLIKKMKGLGEIDNCRHLIISSMGDTAMADLPPEMTLPKLRTLGLKGGILTLDKIHATHLRTLFLNQSGIEEVPAAITLLKHLRYLDLSFNPISTLPESMGELYQLQTLILQGCSKLRTLPRVFYTLVNLRHILTTGPIFEWEESQPLTDPSSLSFLSEDEDIDANVDVVANGDDDEDRDENEIAVLEYKSENEDVFRIVEHESVRDKMFPGNEFHILGLECVNDKEQARKFGLAGKPNVTNLYLSWAAGRQDTSVGNCDEDVLAGLEPHPNIKSIEVQNFLGGKFPTWITGMAVVTGEPSGNRTQLNNLTVLKLLNCRECRTLPNLGQLHHLNNLNLNGFYVGTIGMEFYGGDHLDNPDVVSFKSLKELEVSEFYVLSNWMEPPVGAFPVLETLRIIDCDLLESVPVLGFTSLTSLELRNLKSVESLDIIKYSLGLTSLIMSMLPKIESLPQELADCRMLQTLHISDFHKLASVPSGLESLVNLKSKVVNLRDISATAPMPDDDGCSTNKLEDLHPLLDEFPILGPECAKADEQVGKSLESKEDMEQAGKEINLTGTSLESAKDEDLVGKNLECVEDDELTKETVECVIDKKLSLKGVADSELKGISLEGVKDKEIASKSFEGVEEEEMTGKSLEGAKDKELTENSLECVKDSELVGKSREGAVNKDVVGKSLECVKDKEIAGYGLEGVKDKEIAGKSLEAVEDEEYGVAWRNKVNNSWVDGTGLQQLTNLGEIKGVLQITGLECVKDKEKARKVGLAGKANVSKLKLVWTEGRGETSGGVWDEDVLEALEPHPNITSLEVHNFLGVKFPPWIMEMINWTRFVNLTEVKLLNCSRCRTLPTLGHLPLLRRLFLSGFDVEIIGVEFYGYYDSDLSEKLLPNSRRDIMSFSRRTGWLPLETSFRGLIELDISGFCRLTAWNEPPQAAFPYLETLRIRDCSRLESVPFLSSKTLKVLELKNVDRVRSLDIIKFNRHLTSLCLDGLPNLESLPEELSHCTKLQELKVNGAHKLSRMPNGLKSLVNLRRMMVSNCKVINFVMDDLLHVRSSLKSFGIYGCPMLIKMPSGLQECTSLSELLLDDRHLLNEGSPINISKFQRLLFLGITCSSAEHFRYVLESARGHQVLVQVIIEGFKNEVEMEAYFSDMTPFLHLPSLIHLRLVGHPNIKTLPQQLHQLSQITGLSIQEFEDLEQIPAWICNLKSLRNLNLHNCKNLKYLPSKQDFNHLRELRISHCPLLRKRYAEDGGSLIKYIDYTENDEDDI